MSDPSARIPASRQPEQGSLSLIAHRKDNQQPLDIVPASRWREWMNATDAHFANRCLPLLVANESGWWILNRDAVTLVWDGGRAPASVTVTLDANTQEPAGGIDNGFESTVHVGSIFGYGIVTWQIPYVFRTDAGYNLLARGPANLPKDGVSALEGIVETDWSVAPFTMNWQLTRPGMPVRFEAGEPICMIVPQQRHELESITPRIAELDADPDLCAGYRQFHRSRRAQRLLELLGRAGHSSVGDVLGVWEKHYFKGVTPNGDPAPEHVTKRRLRPFDDSCAAE